MMVTLLLMFVGLIHADPYEFTSNFEMIDYSTNLDNPQYRLLNNVQPYFYNIDLDVDLPNSKFSGMVEVSVTVTGNLSQIVLHQDVVAINAINVLDNNNNPVPLKLVSPFEIDRYYQVVKINFASYVVSGNYTISISYDGQINENPVNRGFYKGYYYANGQKREYATTQFQPYFARHAFPCFDEPQFKSRYVISIVRDSNLAPSFSNMAISATQILSTSRVREIFLPTPRISSYLIAFHVSDFVSGNSTSPIEKPFQIISRPNAVNQHNYPAEIGQKITDELSKYFNYDYYGMGEGQPMKNDHIALPDFPSGAMENWGMVNYREAYLLYQEEHTNIVDKIFIATIMAHELAHKWFGNLVTCFWWSNLWLNESFASYFEYFGAHLADPLLELDDRFIIGRVQSALVADASASAPPMNLSTVADNPSITAHFGTSSYAKGATVLRMMEHFVGNSTFQNALRIYLQENKYGIGYPEDMYNAFRQACANDSTFATRYPNVDVGAVFDNWVQSPGAPVVNVTVNMTTGVITLSQERFLLSGDIPNTIWHIPISWTHGGSPNFNDTRPSFVFSNKTMTIQKEPGHAWVILNLQYSGLYRVNYDDHNWEMIASQLRSNKDVIHKLNRAQIVHDVLFFLRAKKISVARAFDVLSFLKSEHSYYVWDGALTQLDWVRRRLEHLPVAYEEFNDYLMDLLEGAIEELGYDEKSEESVSVTQARMIIMNYACNLGHEGCVKDSLEKWDHFKTNASYLVPKNSRRYVYCTGIRNGSTDDYKFLFEKYNKSENAADMVVMLRALGCTRNETDLKDYLFQSMYNDRIRIHDKTNAFQYALLGNRENLETVLEFLFDNLSSIRDRYGGEARLNICINALSSYLTNFQDVLKFQTWVYSRPNELGNSFSNGVSVVRAALSNIQWGNTIAPELVTAIRNRNGSAAITSSFFLLLLAVTAHLLR